MPGDRFMRYTESKEEATALLRQALAAMGQHDAAFNPLCFAVFYEHAAGINPRLSAALAAAQQAAARLSDDAVRRLYQDHVADVGLAEAQRIQGDMQRVMSDIVQTATRTGQAAGDFGSQLDGLSGALQGNDTQALLSNIDAAREGTQAMRDSVQALQQQVSASRGEIDRLRADLMRTREEATLCPLTHVLNRRGFDERLGQMLEQLPPAGSSHCLIMLDIDHFKRVNDTHGHQVGDRVLEGLGTVLRSVPAEPGMACARYGGEEFAILMPATTLNKAVQVAEAVRSRTRGIRLRNRNTQTVELTVTVSAGVAAWRPGEDAQDLVSHADAALYRSKAGGRDRVMVA
jgi:diguanylate cyclase